jgi:hypothetical protein
VTLEDLVENLTALGVAHEVRHSGADGAILLLPEYGRVLGVWAHWRGENALWVNPDFILSLRSGAKDDGWRNPGGDRVWLAPAEEFLNGSAVPPSIDPGRYVFSSDRGAACMTNRGDAWARASGVRVRFRFTRRVRPLDESGIDAVWGPTWLRRAGFEEEMELEIEGKCAVPVQLWNLVQAQAGSQRLESARGSDGGPRLLCIQDPESERARLLVKSYETGGQEAGPTTANTRGDTASAPVDFACLSPAITRGSMRRLTWKASLCAFSGRSTEVRQFASRIVIF